MKMLMRVSVEVDAQDFREAARQQERFEEAVSSVLVHFPQAAVKVQPVRGVERARALGAGARQRRASGAVQTYRD